LSKSTRAVVLQVIFDGAFHTGQTAGALHSAPFPLTTFWSASIFLFMIELKNVSFSYRLEKGKEVLALDDVSLKLKEGEFVAIIGANGSGKTTLARLLNSLTVPSSGKVLVDELDTSDKNLQKLVRLKVGMVFQNPDNQIISTTVEREIAFGLENLALPIEELKERVEWALSTFNLQEYRNHPPHNLSGGEKQKISLASVLAMKPSYLVLDEPTSLLDAKGKHEVNSLIEELARELTVIHITQFPEEATSARRVLVVDRGKIVLDGPPARVFSQVTELRKMGLGVPVACEIIEELRKGGIKLKSGILKVDELIDEIQNLNTKPKKQVELNFSRENLGNQVCHSVEPLIQAENLSFVYNQGLPTEKKALDGIDFEIEKGDFIGLIGSTGSGKSTLVQHLNALLQPTEGRVWIDKRDLTDKHIDLKKIRQKVGLVFQFPELQLFEDTVFDDIAFGPRNLGLSEQEITKRVRECMAELGLDFETFAPRSPFSLSGGEQRKAAIAGILALNPEVLILDEPTAGLDNQGVEQIKNVLLKLNRDGTTIILISHNLDLVAELTKSILLLDKGKIVCFCKKEEFFREPERLYSAGLKPPLLLEFISKLSRKGFKIFPSLFTIEELASELVKRLPSSRE
jgi:energy-coupling factor transporter ATPase